MQETRQKRMSFLVDGGLNRQQKTYGTLKTFTLVVMCFCLVPEQITESIKATIYREVTNTFPLKCRNKC